MDALILVDKEKPLKNQSQMVVEKGRYDRDLQKKLEGRKQRGEGILGGHRKS